MPDMAMPTASTAEPLTKYGRMRMNYLKRNKPFLYSKLVESGQLYTHCLEIQKQALQSLEHMANFFTADCTQLGLTKDKLVWKKLLTFHRAMAREIIRDNLIHRCY